MGKVTGFLEIERQDRTYTPAADRLRVVLAVQRGSTASARAASSASRSLASAWLRASVAASTPVAVAITTARESRISLSSPRARGMRRIPYSSSRGPVSSRPSFSSR